MEIGQEIIQELLILDKIHILFVASSVVVLRILSLPHCTPPFFYTTTLYWILCLLYELLLSLQLLILSCI